MVALLEGVRWTFTLAQREAINFSAYDCQNYSWIPLPPLLPSKTACKLEAEFLFLPCWFIGILKE